MNRDPSSDSPSTARRVAVWVGAALGALVLLYAGLAVVFQLLLDPATVSRWIEPRAEAALNRDVELGGARPTVFPFLGIDLTDLSVGNLENFEGAELARIERVRLKVALLPLLTRSIRVDEVRVERPRIRLAVDEDGTSNFGDLVPESDPDRAADTTVLSLAIEELTIVDGAFEYASAPDSIRVSLDGVESTASVERRPDDAWSIELEATSDSLAVEAPVLGPRGMALAGPSLETRAAVDADGGWMDLGQGRVRLGEATLGLTGRVEELKEPIRRVDLRLLGENLAVERLAEALPDSVRERLPGAVSGGLRVDVAARGPLGPDRSPTIRGELELSRASLAGDERPALARDVAARILLRGDSVRLEEMTGTVLGGPFSLQGALVTDSLLPVAGIVEARPELGGLTALGVVPDSVELEGRAEMGVSFSGSLRRPDLLRLDGRIRLDRTELRHPRLGVPARVADGRLELAGRTVRWSELEVELGADRIRLDGRLEEPLAVLGDDEELLPTLHATVRSGRLHLDRVVPPRGDSKMTYGRIAFAHLGGRTLNGDGPESVARREGLSRPPPLPLRARIEVEMDSLISDPYRLSDVRARLEADPERLAVSEASYVLFGGPGSVSWSLSLGEDALQPFRMTLATEGSQAADFLEVASPLGRLVTGRLGLEMTTEGSLDTLMLPAPPSLSGNGRFRVRDGGLRENPVTSALARALSHPPLAAPSFRHFASAFRIDGGQLLLDDGSLDTEAGELGFGGALGLGGALDLGVRVSISGSRLDSLALRRSGLASAVAGRLGGAGLVRVGLRLQGTVFDPSVRPDVSLATGRLRDAVEEEVEERVDEVRDTAVARLRQARDSAEERLREERESLEARAREEAAEARRRAEERAEERAEGLLRGLLRRRDTAATPGDTLGPPDTVPPDSIPPDSVPPDTMPPDTTPPDTTRRSG